MHADRRGSCMLIVMHAWLVHADRRGSCMLIGVAGVC